MTDAREKGAPMGNLYCKALADLTCFGLGVREDVRSIRERGMSGAEMAEYAIVIAVIAVVCFVAYQALGKTINNKVVDINTKLSAVTG